MCFVMLYDRMCVYNGESINNGMDYWNGGLAFLLKSSIQVIFKPGVAGRKLALVWFLEIAFVREVGMRVCVCLPPGY